MKTINELKAINAINFPNAVKSIISIADLQVGMTVEHYGHFVTVGKGHVKQGFCGLSFKGDASSKEITRVQFRVSKHVNGIKETFLTF